MNVGDLVCDDHYGYGIVLEMEAGEASIYFFEVKKRCWLDEHMLGCVVEVVNASR